MGFKHTHKASSRAVSCVFSWATAEAWVSVPLEGEWHHLKVVDCAALWSSTWKVLLVLFCVFF